MNITQMHQAFMLELDKSNALEYPSFLPEEKDYWLNRAIREFVKTRYSGFNIKRQGFEESQKRIEDIRPLICEDHLVPVIDPTNTSYIDDITVYNVDLTTTTYPYWLAIGEEVAIEYMDCNTVVRQKRSFVIETTFNEYAREIVNPYSEYRLENGIAKPLRLFAGDNVELITDGNYVPILYYLNYIRKPAEVSITTPTDCDLAESVHDEIINLACSMVLENIESKRLQSQTIISNKEE